MFETFYKLNDNPFRLTPDPKFCFRHPGHEQAYAYLQYALRLGEGFILVTGRPGIGKTTLAEVFLAELEFTEVVAARVASVNVEAADLMRVVAYAYGIDAEGLDKATTLVRLKQFFVEQTESGKRVLLIVDEAQGLPYPALEELRLLADLQMDSLPLVQLFLVGQEKLHDLMQEPAMEQFQQRVIGACHLEPLCLADSRAYMEHRLRKANWKGDPELSGEAVLEIYRFSKGVPRHINKICTRLLLGGFMEKKHKLDRSDVLGVADALRVERLAPLGDKQAAAVDVKDTELLPELENGTLTIADLALRADPEQPPLPASPTTPEVVTEVEKRAGPRHTKQVTANRRGRNVQRQHPERVSIPSWQPNPEPRTDLWNRFPGRAFVRVKERATEAARQLDISGLGAKLLHYRKEIEQKFENHTWFEGKIGMWVGAAATVALALTLLLNSAEEDVGSHSVMLEEYPEAAGVAREFESASFETVEYKPVASGVEGHTDDSWPTYKAELLQHGDMVTGSPVQNPALITPEEEPEPATLSPYTTVVLVQDTAGTVEEIQPPEPSVEQESNLATEEAVQADNVSEVVAFVESSEPEPVSSEDRIIELLSLGQRALRSDRLLIPPDNNAYQYYQRVLELEHGNSAALFGMDQIVARYVSLGETALGRQDKDRVKRYIARGYRVIPGDSRLMALQDSVDALDAPKVQVDVQQHPVGKAEKKEKNLLSRLKAFFSKSQTADETNEVPVEDLSY